VCVLDVLGGCLRKAKKTYKERAGVIFFMNEATTARMNGLTNL